MRLYLGSQRQNILHLLPHLSSQSELDKGVVTASAGNHAQGVAFSAKHLGCKATIVMPIVTPEIKVSVDFNCMYAPLPPHPPPPTHTKHHECYH
jgi:hypothetical protein